MHNAPSSYHWPRRIILGLLAFGLILAIAGAIYEHISEARDGRLNSMDGMLFDVGGFKMHINCTGKGGPAVILESGLGDTYLSWRKVQPRIAQFTRVCSYDRAGIGYSDSSSRPRTSKVMAEELHALLRAAGFAPPYILVGHSMGGYNVRLYASQYRHEVAGMVLVDASHPDQENRFPLELRNREGTWLREAEFLEYAMPFGIPRLMGLCEEEPTQRAAECNFHSAREGVAELKTFPESASQTAATGSLSDMPLAVLSHDPNKPSADLPAGYRQADERCLGKNARGISASLHPRDPDDCKKQRALYSNRSSRRGDRSRQKRGGTGACSAIRTRFQIELIFRNLLLLTWFA